MGIYYTQRMAVQGGEMLVHYVGRPVHRAVRQPDEAELSDWALATVLDHLPIDAVLAGFDSALLHLGMINIRLRTPPPRIINIRLLRTPPPRNQPQVLHTPTATVADTTCFNARLAAVMLERRVVCIALELHTRSTLVIGSDRTHGTASGTSTTWTHT